MRFNRRRVVLAMLLGATVGLSGCNSAPPDPYSGMRMLTPQEVGTAETVQDPVLQAEKVHNAQFAGTDRRTP
jgi:hypothetical protein